LDCLGNRPERAWSELSCVPRQRSELDIPWFRLWKLGSMRKLSRICFPYGMAWSSLMNWTSDVSSGFSRMTNVAGTSCSIGAIVWSACCLDTRSSYEFQWPLRWSRFGAVTYRGERRVIYPCAQSRLSPGSATSPAPYRRGVATDPRTPTYKRPICWVGPQLQCSPKGVPLVVILVR
jgi:hypothetical protein